MNTIFDSKFIITIKTFAEEELKLFHNWLKSPYCNSNKNLITLFEKVRKYHPDFDNPKLTKERLFFKILPQGKFSHRRMNNLLSEGYLAAEKFLIFQNIAKDERLQKDLLTKEFQHRNTDDWFFKTISKEIDKLKAKSVKEWEEHLDLLRLGRRVYLHPNQNLVMSPGDQTIVDMGKQIDLIYLLEKAFVINEKISRNRVFKNENHDVGLALEKWFKASEGIEHPVVDFYKIRFNYSESNMLEQYFVLRNTYEKRYKELNKADQKVHLLSLINDTTKLWRARKIDITEFLPLYKLGLKTAVLLTNGKLTHITYTTIVTVSNTKKDFAFTNEFIQKYTDKLDEGFRPDALNWANAHTAYRKKDLSNCIDILLGHNFKIFHFQILTKSLTTQVYFDLYLEDDTYLDYLFNYFDSFEKWLYREKFSSEVLKKGFLKFVQKSRILAKYYSDADFQKEKVENLLNGESNVQGSKWLGVKIKQIIESRS